MKKILSLICAVALVSGASAQVKQAKAEVGTPAYQVEQASMPAVAKPGSEEELIAVEALARATGTDGKFMCGYSCTGLPQNALGQADWSRIGSIPAVWFTMGSGWANCKYGSGEFGYSLDFTERSYYIWTLDRPYNEYGIVGAYVLVGRAKTTVDSVNAKRMPLRFKLYSAPTMQVTEQEAFEDLTSKNSYQRKTVAYLPQDPDQYLCLSDTVGVPVMEPEQGQSGNFGSDWFGARFPTPGIAGKHPCISIVFPRTGDGEDSLWNATLFEVSNESGNPMYSTSKFPPMYAVYDFKYQSVWGYESEEDKNKRDFWRDRVDHEGADEVYFIPNQAAQPNTRYAVVPMRSWNWTDANGSPTDRQDGEIAMQLILAEGVTMERGAAYDKYVEVKINPAIDYTVIAATDRIKNVEIYNLSGKLVKTQACNSNVETISLSGLNSGMYIAKVTTEAGVANKKIMVR
ncbi:MAG: T9SS type A sorting domain-containing protein [Bacteroidales bacterium]|nr:T9SS type A sorting domain-containing protein [Bacteroidales bacterium]